MAVFPFLIAVLVSATAAWSSETLVVSGDMVIDKDITVSNVVFTAGATVSGSGSIMIDSEAGITVPTGGVCTVALPIGAGQPIGIGGRAVLRLVKGGAFAGKATVTDTVLQVSGTLAVTNGLVFRKTAAANGRAELRLDNALVKAGDKTILLQGEGAYYPLRALAGTTNRVEGACQIINVARPWFGANSLTTFAGPCTWGSFLVPECGANARIVFERPLFCWDFGPVGRGTFAFRCAGNKFRQTQGIGARMVVPAGSTVRTEAGNAFNDNFPKLVLNGTLDLAGRSQQFGPIAGAGVVESEGMAALRVRQVAHPYGAPVIAGATTNTIWFKGGASLEKSGAFDLLLAGRSSTTGTLSVTEGVLGFAKHGAWPNCAAVSVSGTGRLVIPSERAFSPFADVFIATGKGAKVEIAEGVSKTCRDLYVDGVRQPAGTFSAATHGDWLAGGGSLCATGGSADASSASAATRRFAGDPNANILLVDAGGGAEFTSIDEAVAEAQPGDIVRVMPGLYRETVVVRRGGTESKPIVIESAVRGGAVVRGSEVWKNAWAPLDGHPGVLSSPIDESLFTNGVVNPYATTISIGGGIGKRARFETNDVVDVEQFLPRTLGQMFIEGRPVTEVTSVRALYESPNTWMVSPKGGEIWLHPSVTDIPLDGRLVEWTVRDRLLHAARRGLGYVVVRGFVFEHCANQGPFPQRGAVDVRSGHFWTVEHNMIRFAKTIGLAVGSETWNGKSLTDVPESDRRVMQSVNVHVRYNTVSDNGMCGIAAWNPVNLRIYNNVVERNNAGCYWWRYRYWDETAGIKVHCGTTVVANNLVRDNEAHGIWFDTGFHRVRITGNAILNNRRSGIMFETAFGSALVDCNVIAYTRQDGDTYYAGDGIYSHNGSGVTVAHNLLAGNAGMGVRFRTTYGKIDVWTAGKPVKRDVETSGNRYLNNIFYENAAGDLMVSATNRLSNGTVSEGNLYLKDGRRSVRYPFRFADYNIDIEGGFSNVWKRVAAADPANALPFAAWSALERPATLAEWRAVQGLDTTSQAMSGAYIDTITRDLLLVLRLPKELREFRGKGVAGIDMDFRGKPYPGPDADVRPGPCVGFDWDDAGVQFALDPFERPTPPAIPAR